MSGITSGGPGVMAAYATADGLLDALRALRNAGYTELDAYTPYEIEEVDEVLELGRSRLPAVALVAGLLGAALGYGIQWWTSVVDYPIDVGGRPLHAAPAFVMITFELGILFAAGALFVAYFWRSGLPALWSPEFEVPGFERASVDRFWVAVGRGDPRFDSDHLSRLLEESGAERVRVLDGSAKDGEEREGRPGGRTGEPDAPGKGGPA